MMRQFKAWDKDKKEWVTDFLLSPDGEILQNEAMLDNRNLVIIWATGRKTKDGREIWGTDIVLARAPGYDKRRKFIIDYQPKRGEYQAWPTDKMGLSDYFEDHLGALCSFSDLEDIEIAGNILEGDKA